MNLDLCKAIIIIIIIIVVVDCQFNVANQEAQFTVTGTLTGGGTPTTISIYGCPHQANIDASDQATIDFSTQCPNVDWVGILRRLLLCGVADEAKCSVVYRRELGRLF